MGAAVNVLIVETSEELAQLWQRHLLRAGLEVDVAHTHAGAINALTNRRYAVIVLDLVIADGSALAIADFANYRHPESRVIFVTNTTFFSDGSIFNLSSNACAYVQSTTKPDDLAVIVEHHASYVG